LPAVAASWGCNHNREGETVKAINWIRSFVVLGLMFAFVSIGLANPKAKVIAVVNRAEWCSVCKANAERAGKIIMEAAADGTLQVVVNDITNGDTTKASAVALKAAGVDRAMAPYTATGVLYLFDAASKKPLRQITVANADAELKQVLELAKKDAGH
jgi:hypothetical protein